MTKLIVKKMNSYLSKFLAQSDDVDILALFLCSQVLSHTENHKNYINQMKLNQCGSGNCCLICSWEEGIGISDLYDENEENPFTVTLSKETCLKMLDDWGKMYKLMPNWVVIDFENDAVSMQPYDELPDEELMDPAHCAGYAGEALEYYAQRMALKREKE